MEFIASHGVSFDHFHEKERVARHFHPLSLQIVHRDLAARNILIDEKFAAKIGDFGMSRSIRDKESDMYEMKHSGQLPIRWVDSLQ